jgi:predicted transcriptional regulator
MPVSARSRGSGNAELLALDTVRGRLGNDGSEATHVYRATRPQQRVVGDMLRDFVDRVFNGSAEPLLQHLVRDGRLSASELRTILRCLGERK